MTLALAFESVAILPELSAGQVNVIACPLEFSHGDESFFWRTLSDDERARADRFAFEVHRSQFIACRGFLRRYLGLCLSLEPAAIAIKADGNGKPRLASQGPSDLRFNLSHSKELAIFAFAIGLEVGIDVEYVDPSRDIVAISSRYFSMRERSSLEGLSAEEQTEAFFRCWTRNEAYLKARGDGLSVPLDGFDVSISDELSPDLTSEDCDRWRLYSLKPACGYLAALAIENHANVSIRTLSARVI